MTCVFEVKEFDDPAARSSGGFSPCPPIREKIHTAAKPFKNYKSDCCALIFWNTNFYRNVKPPVVLSTAFGEYVRENRSPLGAEPSSYHFSGRAELRPDCNTRFSAIVVLAPYRLNLRASTLGSFGTSVSRSVSAQILTMPSPPRVTAFSAATFCRRRCPHQAKPCGSVTTH